MQLHGVINSLPSPCPVCGAASPLFGVVDLHKSCLEAEMMRAALSGVPVYYRQCSDCRFVFTDAFDDWSPDDFRRHIYNDQYQLIDPKYAEKRPNENAILVDRMLSGVKQHVSLIDYGGGSGVLSEILRRKGYKAETFDPFSGFNKRPEGMADIVTAFEVVEHSNRPHETMNEMLSMLKPEGILIFSTLLQPPDFEQMGLNWWYIGPRNGHVSIYSAKALEKLLSSKGVRSVSMADSMHFAIRGTSWLLDEILKNNSIS